MYMIHTKASAVLCQLVKTSQREAPGRPTVAANQAQMRHDSEVSGIAHS